MLYLQDIFNDLAFSKFSNMHVGKSVTNSIQETQYPKVVSLINAALLDIYNRLLLSKKEFDLYQREGVTTYYIRSEHVGDPNIGDPDIYIDGTDSKGINGDIIKLIEAYDSTGEEIYINNNSYPDDIFLLSHDTIKVALRDPLEVISVVYQASYPKITIGTDFNPKTYELYFPYYIIQAVTNYVASEWFVGHTSQAIEGQPSLANTFRYAYEKELVKIMELNLVMNIDEKQEQFTNNGWV